MHRAPHRQAELGAPEHFKPHDANSGGEDAVLFSTTDAPMLDALVLLEEHEYPGNGHQEVTSTYAERYGNTADAQWSGPEPR